MTDVYVLIGDSGEYADFTRDVLGTFSSHEAARAAIPKLRAYGAAQWKAYQERDQKRKNYLTRFEPRFTFSSGDAAYSIEQYAEAEEACGAEPALVPDSDTYIIERYVLDAIEAGSLIEEIAGEQAAADEVEGE